MSIATSLQPDAPRCLGGGCAASRRRRIAPPYAKLLLPQLVRHWLGLLEPVGGQLCLLLRVLWGEGKGGQVLTTKHPAYAGKLKTLRRILCTKELLSTMAARRRMNMRGFCGTGAVTRRQCRPMHTLRVSNYHPRPTVVQLTRSRLHSGAGFLTVCISRGEKPSPQRIAL